jgi:hypothetical protein
LHQFFSSVPLPAFCCCYKIILTLFILTTDGSKPGHKIDFGEKYLFHTALKKTVLKRNALRSGKKEMGLRHKKSIREGSILSLFFGFAGVGSSEEQKEMT